MTGRDDGRGAPGGDADWLVICAAILAGVVTAMQIGKASAALPALREGFGVGLADASLYFSLFSLGAALLSTAVGMVVLRIRPLRAGLTGLVLIGCGSLAGGMAEGWAGLLAARIIEALGLPLVVCAMPALIQSCSSGRQRVLAMGFWAAWLPLGLASAMVIPVPWEAEGAWRQLFMICGVLPLVSAGYLLVISPRVRTHTSREIRQAAAGWPDAATVAAAVLFALFQGSYLTVQGFFPTIALDAWSLDMTQAARLGGLSALFVIIGNVAASFLLSGQVSAAKLLVVSFAVMGVCALAFFFEPLPLSVRLGAVLIFITLAGVPPAVIWGLVPQLAARSGAGAAITAGAVYQGAGTGQLVGPLAAGTAVDAMGNWSGGALVTTACSVVAIVITVRFVGGLSERPA